MKRVAGNAGAFYPNSCAEIEGMIAHFNKILDGANEVKRIVGQKSRAIISPHAGYVYSGFTANVAHRILGNQQPKRVIIIGPSHHVYFEGLSISKMDSYETPCSDMEIDINYIAELESYFECGFAPQAHHLEHSTETQIPFIKHYNPDAQIVEIIYGNADHNYLSKVIDHILSDPDNGIVISSDLSHFYTLQKAEQLDGICLEGVARLDLNILSSGCEACGIIGIKAMVESAIKLGFRSRLLDYRTSADASGDTSRVVGYMSAMFE